jgi:hypothetical protein
MIKLLPLWEKINNLLPIKQGEFITFLIDSSCKFNFYYGIDSYENYLIAIETIEEPQQIKLNSNKTGILVNLSTIPPETVDEILKYLNYVSDQEYSISQMESTAEELKQFISEKDHKDVP